MKTYCIFLLFILSFGVSNAQEALLRNGRSVVYTGGKRYLEPEESEYFQTVVLKTVNTFKKTCPDNYVLSKMWSPNAEDAQRTSAIDKTNKPLAYEVILKWTSENNTENPAIWMKIIVNPDKFSVNGTAPFQLKQDSLAYFYNSKLIWNETRIGLNYTGNGAIVPIGHWNKPITAFTSGKSTFNISALWPSPSFLQVNNVLVIIAAPEAIIQEMLDKIPAERLTSLLNYKEYWP